MQTISQKNLEDTMYYRNIPVFIYRIHYPFFTSTCSAEAVQSINDHYAAAAKRTEVYCRTILYPQAVESARYIQINQPPFHSYEFYADYRITYNWDCITSLYLEQYTYMGGAHGTTLRESNTWDFSTGYQLQLQNFYPLNSTFPENILKNIEGQVTKRLESSPSSYFDNYAALLRNNFSLNNFYLEPNIIVIYFQQYDIAPYASGIPEFRIPIPGS